MGILSFLKNVERARRKGRYDAQSRAFETACTALTKDDIAIDCGANVGVYTTMMADSGACIFAFEPNPVAFAKLREKTAAYPNVRLFNAAVSTESGNVRLYMHKRARLDPLLYSVSSSTMATKTNVDAHSFEDVESIVLADFIESLECPVKLLKMDVEGAEIGLLNQLLDRELHNRLNRALSRFMTAEYLS